MLDVLSIAAALAAIPNGTELVACDYINPPAQVIAGIESQGLTIGPWRDYGEERAANVGPIPAPDYTDAFAVVVVTYDGPTCVRVMMFPD